MTKVAPHPARILIAAQDPGTGEGIAQQLQEEFADVRISTDLAQAAMDFEEFDPDVVVLAFQNLAGAKNYCQALKGTRTEPLPEHRTVILCSRAECATVVEQCKLEEFDDYVLYWPQPYDGFRLAMSLRIACREMAAIRASRRLSLDLVGQAKHVDELDRLLEVELGDMDRRVVGIKQSLASTERDIVRAVDGLSETLSDPAAEWVAVKDREMLAREIDQLKNRQVDTVRRSGELEIESMRARSRHLKDQLEPSLTGARALANELRKLKPMVMVVEDDEFARELVRRALDPVHWEAVFASDGASAISQLRFMRPDVILMDVRLPGIDGVSLTHRLKASPHLAEIPIIMMTGDASKETVVSSLEAGAAGFVVKPVTRAVLAAKLEKLFPR